MSDDAIAISWPEIQYDAETVYGPVTGSVYFATIGDPYPTHVKIGFTRGNPRQRIKDLQTGCPFKITLIGYVSGCTNMEAELHSVLSDYRTQGEWFVFDGYAEVVIDSILTFNHGGV